MKSFLKNIVVVASLGKNSFVDSLEIQKKIDLSGLRGKWESFLIKTIKNPTKDLEQVLLIIGSDILMVHLVFQNLQAYCHFTGESTLL